MSIYSMLLIGIIICFIFICIIIIKALNPVSKACKLDTNFNANGFKITFKTNEKSTPSDQE